MIAGSKARILLYYQGKL